MAVKIDAGEITSVQLKNTTDPGASTSGYGEVWLKSYAPYIRRTDSYAAFPIPMPGGRLTLTTATPVTTSSVTAAGTIYYTPYVSDTVPLYNGTEWEFWQFTELSLALTATSGTVYDVFVYNNSGTLTLVTTAWSSATARATSLTWLNGRLVQTGTTGRLYLGSFYASGTNQTQDTAAGRHLINFYNRLPVNTYLDETADISIASTSYAAATASLTVLTLGGESILLHGSLGKGSTATQDHRWRFNWAAGTYYYAGASTAGSARESSNSAMVGVTALGARTVTIEWAAIGAGTATNRPTSEPYDNFRRLIVNGIAR